MKSLGELLADPTRSTEKERVLDLHAVFRFNRSSMLPTCPIVLSTVQICVSNILLPLTLFLFARAHSLVDVPSCILCTTLLNHTW